MKYRVLSQLSRRPAPAESPTAVPAIPVHELTRTDYKVAQADVAIITDIFRRKAWIEEVA